MQSAASSRLSRSIRIRSRRPLDKKAVHARHRPPARSAALPTAAPPPSAGPACIGQSRCGRALHSPYGSPRATSRPLHLFGPPQSPEPAGGRSCKLHTPGGAASGGVGVCPAQVDAADGHASNAPSVLSSRFMACRNWKKNMVAVVITASVSATGSARNTAVVFSTGSTAGSR